MASVAAGRQDDALNCDTKSAEIRKKLVLLRGYPKLLWHSMRWPVKLIGELCYLWRAADHEGDRSKISG
jgi:hypothetical protein